MDPLDGPLLRHPGRRVRTGLQVDLRSRISTVAGAEDGWPQWLDITGVHGIDPDPGPRFEHCNLTLRAASDGQGVAMAYDALVTRDLATGALVRLFDISLSSTVIYSLVCPGTHLAQPRVRAFRVWLINAAESDHLQADAPSTSARLQAAG